ncbi:MAG: addiction module antidote protein [Castellaniella sp.]|jgi:probable addiction module antidote protein
MTEIFQPYDTAEHLRDEADIAAYLEAVLKEAGDDASFVAHALGIMARARSMTELARKTGMSREGLYKELSEDGNPSFATVLKVIRALGLKLQHVPDRAAR